MPFFPHYIPLQSLIYVYQCPSPLSNPILHFPVSGLPLATSGCLNVSSTLSHSASLLKDKKYMEEKLNFTFCFQQALLKTKPFPDFQSSLPSQWGTGFCKLTSIIKICILINRTAWFSMASNGHS